MVVAIQERGRVDTYDRMAERLKCTRPNVCIIMKKLLRKGYVRPTGHARRPYTPIPEEFDGELQAKAEQTAGQVHTLHQVPVAGKLQDPAPRKIGAELADEAEE